MPRTSGPWWRASRSMYFSTIDGKQTPLGIDDEKDKAGAYRALEAILAQLKAPSESRTVSELVRDFLRDCESRVKPRTLKGYVWYGKLFAEKFGPLKAADLDPRILEADARRSTWAPSTRNNYLSTAATILAWGGVKLSRPLKKPPKESAGAETVIPQPLYRRALQFCSGDWYAVVRFLWETGARPSEASAVTVENVDWEAKIVRLRDHKTRATSKSDRLIYLNATALEVLEWQKEQYPTGLLFRSQSGGALTTHAFAQKFWRLSKQVGRRITAYGCRHSWASRALAAGESDAIVAHLLGHAGTNMVHRHYSHLGEHARELREAAERIARTA
jgi:integrase